MHSVEPGTTVRGSGARLWRRAYRAVLLVVSSVACCSPAGSTWFVSQMPVVEVLPSRQADGIVVLTGGGAAHQRCAGASLHRPWPAAPDQRRQPQHPVLRDRTAGAGASALVHLLRRPRPFGDQHHRQRHRDPPLGRGPRLQVGDRGHGQLPHAARHGRSSAMSCPRSIWCLTRWVPTGVKVDDWWDNPDTARLLILNMLKYIVARVRHDASGCHWRDPGSRDLPT